MRLLVGPRPRVDVPELVVLALPAEGTGCGPGLDDELVGLLEPLPVVGRRRVVGHALPSGAAHPPGYQAATGDHVDHRELFHQPQRVVPDGDDVAQQNDLGALGDAGEDGCLDVHGAAHAEGRAVVLVEHQAVETHLLCVKFFVKVAVVELGTQLGVIDLVADGEIHDGFAGGPEVPGVRVLVGSLSEISDVHGFLPSWAWYAKRRQPPGAAISGIIAPLTITRYGVRRAGFRIR